MHRVFVYGTLKRGFPNHHFMNGATFVGTGATVEAYPLVVGGQFFTPYLLPEPGVGQRIRGELWDVPDAMLPALDDLESVHLPNGYRRQQITIEPDGGGDQGAAWTYFRERRHIALVHTGYLDDYQDRRYVARLDRDV